MTRSNPFFQRNLFRPSPAPALALALGARSVGHYRVRLGYRAIPIVKHFAQIFWGVEGVGAFIIGGRERLLHPNQVAIYFPGQRHLVTTRTEPWEYRWWTMDGPLAQPIVSAFGLAPGVFDAAPPPAGLFQQLHQAILNPTPDGERQAGILAYQLLARAAAGARSALAGTRVETALAAANHQWNNPGFSVKALADQLGVHRSQLSREFRRVTGVPLMEYVLRLRLQQALSLLKTSDDPIREIAPRCGFQDPDYFARLIRRKFHAAPSQIRRAG